MSGTESIVMTGLDIHCKFAMQTAPFPSPLLLYSRSMPDGHAVRRDIQGCRPPSFTAPKVKSQKSLVVQELNALSSLHKRQHAQCRQLSSQSW